MDPLEKLRSELKKDTDDCLSLLAHGVPGTSPGEVVMAYKYTCGILAGVALAQNHIRDLMAEMAADEVN